VATAIHGMRADAGTGTRLHPSAEFRNSRLRAHRFIAPVCLPCMLLSLILAGREPGGRMRPSPELENGIANKCAWCQLRRDGL
jgi:hypothetical protein